MRVNMIATKDMTYGTRRLKADDEFEATRPNARLLEALGRARLVEDTPKPHALDHDRDGRKGGSEKGPNATRRRKKAAKATEV